MASVTKLVGFLFTSKPCEYYPEYATATSVVPRLYTNQYDEVLLEMCNWIKL